MAITEKGIILSSPLRHHASVKKVYLETTQNELGPAFIRVLVVNDSPVHGYAGSRGCCSSSSSDSSSDSVTVSTMDS